MTRTVPLYGFGGGSGTGATLTVTAPAGATITVSKDGKSKNKISDSSGAAVFKGLSTGTWTLTISDGSQTASKPVMITADYSAEITFFAATIHITYPAGSTCTATDGVTTLTAPDTSGTWDCVVPNAGTWTVTVVDKGWSDAAEVVEDGQIVPVYLDEYYLYCLGNEFPARTGGWVETYQGSGNKGTFEKAETYLYYKTDSASTANGVTKNKIDVTNFSEIVVEVSDTLFNASDQFSNYSICLPSSIDPIANWVAITYTTDNSATVDISGISGDYFLAVITGTNVELKVTKEYLR